MSRKLVSSKEASKIIKDGMRVAVGGLTIHRKPMSLIHEVLRSGTKGLRVLTLGGGPDVDLLVAAGAVEGVEAAYVGFEILGFAPNFRKAAETGRIKFTEHTEYSIMAGLQATAFEAEFIPSKLLMGTDILKALGYKIFDSPITGEPLVAYPRIVPDVTLIHAQRADQYGNAQVEGVTAIDLLLAKASKKVILSAEKIVTTDEIMKVPSMTNLPSTFVDAVVECRYGAHPTSCYPYYTYDLWNMISYLESAKTGKIDEYLRRYITGLDSFESYLDEVGEESRKKIEMQR